MIQYEFNSPNDGALDLEALAWSGDSGGPTFINGQIAGVNSGKKNHPFFCALPTLKPNERWCRFFWAFVGGFIPRLQLGLQNVMIFFLVAVEIEKHG